VPPNVTAHTNAHRSQNRGSKHLPHLVSLGIGFHPLSFGFGRTDELDVVLNQGEFDVNEPTSCPTSSKWTICRRHGHSSSSRVSLSCRIASASLPFSFDGVPRSTSIARLLVLDLWISLSRRESPSDWTSRPECISIPPRRSPQLPSPGDRSRHSCAIPVPCQILYTVTNS